MAKIHLNSTYRSKGLPLPTGDHKKIAVISGSLDLPFPLMINGHSQKSCMRSLTILLTDIAKKVNSRWMRKEILQGSQIVLFDDGNNWAGYSSKTKSESGKSDEAGGTDKGEGVTSEKIALVKLKEELKEKLKQELKGKLNPSEDRKRKRETVTTSTDDDSLAKKQKKE